MSIFAKLAFKNLKENKNRTLITVIGIIMSTAMICGLVSLISSFQRFFYNNTVAEIGSWDVMYDSLSDEQSSDMTSDADVNYFLQLQNLGYAEIENYNEFKPYLFVGGLPQDYSVSQNEQELFPIHLKEGHYPISPEEIILPDHFLKRTEKEYKIGDQITLNIGQRTLQNDNNDEPSPDESGTMDIGQNNSTLTQFTQLITDDNAKSIEKIEKPVSKTYTISGFYERSDNERFEAPGYMALTIADESLENQNSTYYIKLNQSKDSFSFLEKYPLDTFHQANNEALRYKGISTNDGFIATMVAMGTIFMAIIMVASVTLISNAFNITLSERVKQFGILASVGASKKQLRKSILIEALMICVISLPLGIIAGLLGIKVTLIYIQQIASGVSQNFMGRVPIYLHVSWIGIVISIVVTLITVLISAYRPALKASRISPVEAIRQSKEITAKPVKVSRFNQKLFGTSGFIATKYYKHSKRKYRSTVFSLMISIILFITAFTFTKTMTNSVNNIFYSSEADISVYANVNSVPDGMELDFSTIRKDFDYLDGINSTKIFVQQMPDIVLGKESMSKSALKQIGSPDVYLREIGQNKYLTSVNVIFLEKEDFEDVLKSANIAVSDYQVKVDDKYQPIVYNQEVLQSTDRKYFEYDLFSQDADASMFQMKVLPDYSFSFIEEQNGKPMAGYAPLAGESDYKYIPMEDAIESTVQMNMKYFTDEFPKFLLNSPFISLFFPMEMKDEILLKGNYTSEKLLLDTQENKHQDVVKYLDQYTNKVGGNLNFLDLYELEKTSEGLVKMLNVFCYGFIVLISLIALTNVFNTITTNISLRKRDFAMLKSVGMSEKGFKGMAVFECILYGTRSILFGIPLAIGISLLIQKAMGETYQTAYFIPWNALGISVVVIFVFVAVSMFYAMSKMRRMNIIETLKNDLM